MYRHVVDSLSTLDRSDQFTMVELHRKRDEMRESQDEVLELSNLLSSKKSTIKDLCASRKFMSQKLDVAKHNIEVL